MGIRHVNLVACPVELEQDCAAHSPGDDRAVEVVDELGDSPASHVITPCVAPFWLPIMTVSKCGAPDGRVSGEIEAGSPPAKAAGTAHLSTVSCLRLKPTSHGSRGQLECALVSVKDPGTAWRVMRCKVFGLATMKGMGYKPYILAAAMVMKFLGPNRRVTPERTSKKRNGARYV